MQNLKFYFIPFAISFSYLALQWFLSPNLQKQFVSHNPIFFTANNLVQHGIFGHGRGKIVKPERSVSPGLPFLIAGYALIDSRFKQALACSSGLNCKTISLSESFRILGRYYGIHFLFMLGAALAGFYLAYILSGSWHTAVLTMILLLLGSEFFTLGKRLQPYIYQYFIVYMASIFLILMAHKKSIIYSVLAGGGFGLTALFQSHFIFGLILLVPLIIIALILNRDWKAIEVFGVSLGLLLGVVCVVGLWSFRNYQLFGDFWLTPHGTARLLADRIGYNAMSMSDSFLAILHFLPSYASDLGDLIIKPELKQKLGFYVPGTYIYQGKDILTDVMKVEKQSSLRFITLIKFHILPNFWHHMQVSLMVFTKGLWAGGSFVVLAGLFFIPRLIKINLKKKEFFPLALIFIVMLSFAIAFALVTPAVVWLNLTIIFIYCYAISYVVGGV